MRIFVALRPSEAFRRALSVLQDRLREAGVAGRYLDPSSLHLTLAFIGEWQDNIASLLPAVDSPFSIVLSCLGFFPEAKVLWAGTESSEDLNRLAGRVRQNLAEKGIPFDAKKFTPHITLVRKPVIPEGKILSEISIPPASMIVDEVCLYRSDHEENGMVYSVIGSTLRTSGES